MYAIDILDNSGHYTTKQQIFEDLPKIAQDLEVDLQKMILKNGGYIGIYWSEFLNDSIKINIAKLQKMKNDKTVEFWNANTSIKGALKIVQSMIRSEIQNAMDSKRGGNPLINEINLYNSIQIEDLRQGDNSDIRHAEAEMDVKKIGELEPKTFIDGILVMAQDMIFDKNPEDIREDIEYLCKEYGFDFKKIIPDVQKKFNKMIEAGEIKIAENNQMFFDF